MGILAKNTAMYKKCLAIFALASLAAASLNEAGVNLGGDSLDEIDRKVEALLQKNNLDVEAFTTEYLISNGLKLSLDEAREASYSSMKRKRTYTFKHISFSYHEDTAESN